MFGERNKRNEEEKILKGKEGITLIALVITIIVLLILAGVSIAMLTGDSGILTQAQNAKTNTDRASMIEQVKLDILEKQIGGTTIYKEDIQQILDKYFTGVTDDINSNTNLQTKPEYGDYTIKVSEIYEGELKNKPIKASELNDEEKKELYGKYVTNYECANNDAIETEEGIPGKWMIFHIDDDNIYLIASEYISVVPDGKSGGKPIVGANTAFPKGVQLHTILNDYANGSSEVSEIGKKLNNDYFYVKKFASTNENIKAVAYMLDTNVWSGFKGDDADYAIGGPTVELLLESYNKKYGTNYVAEATSNTGYQVGTDIASSYNLTLSQVNDPTYVINSVSNANAMKVASPAAKDYNGIIGVGNDGNVAIAHQNDNAYGLRPLVCLRSNVKLRKTGDSTYEIIK